MWGVDAPNLVLMIEGGILHAAWHFGQVALLLQWRRVHDTHEIDRPPEPAPRTPKYGGAFWDDCGVKSRTEACLRLLEASYEKSPWHSIHMATKSVSARELNWRPFRIPPPRCMGAHTLLVHVAWCKVMYANHGFGDADVEDVGQVLGERFWEGAGPRKLRQTLDLSQEYLMDHVAQAGDAGLDRVRKLHHGRRMKGWQVVACMAQHDAWHAGQISVLRDAHGGLARTRE
jgi:hypothetical protein